MWSREEASVELFILSMFWSGIDEIEFVDGTKDKLGSNTFATSMDPLGDYPKVSSFDRQLYSGNFW